MVEAQLAKCCTLLEKFVPGFKIEDIDNILHQEGLIFPPPSSTNPDDPLNPNPPLSSIPSDPALHPIKREPQTQQHPPTPLEIPRLSDPISDGATPSAAIHGTAYHPNSYSDVRPSNGDVVRGQDPLSNDLSSTGGLIKAFGVSKSIIRDLPKPDANEGEDLLGGVRMYSDPVVSSHPKRASLWTLKPLPRRSGPLPSQPPVLPHQAQVFTSGVTPPRQIAFHLPRDRSRTTEIVRLYFERLNWHRPIFFENDFMIGLNALYDAIENPSKDPNYSPQYGPGVVTPSGIPYHDDPGFLCSVYLVLALGTLAEENHGFHMGEGINNNTTLNWPGHEEFFELALAVKPDLRVTITSLQALILLQWYLYTERHGRTLWRLVGNLVRLAVELGLHHDPSEQGSTFGPAECELRCRLWWIVMIHDRGTSVLLGRPLAIADQDFNTPVPNRFNATLFSEHFDHSSILASIQGEIINALYRPGRHKQTSDQVLRHASRITKSLANFKTRLPESYLPFFEGAASWTEQEKIQLVTNVTEDQGLTLLKYGIARILLLRALFTSSQVNADARRRALKDAVITSHNILMIQCQLTSVPSIAFFVSPIPIHIAAMVILYGVISECNALPYAKSKEDVCIALQIVPLFRWRWNRKDSHGSHPLIVKLAQKVFGETVLSVSGPVGPPMLIPEWDWSEGENMIPGVTQGMQSDGPPNPPVRQSSINGSLQQQQSPVIANTTGGSGYATDNGQTGGASNGAGYQAQHGTHSRQSSSISNGPGGSNQIGPSPQMADVNMVGAAGGLQNQLAMPSPPNGQNQRLDYSPSGQSGGHGDTPTYQRFDDAEREAVVMMMYPPPLDNLPPTGHMFGELPPPAQSVSPHSQQPNYSHPQANRHGQQQQPYHVQPPADLVSPMHPTTMQSHVNSQPQHRPHIPQQQQQQHHANHHHTQLGTPVPGAVPSHANGSSPNTTTGHYFGTQMSHLAYADYGQSANYFVQEEYDGGDALAFNHHPALQHHQHLSNAHMNSVNGPHNDSLSRGVYTNWS
ncbi:hypothetical protein FRC03_006714 [Tulasnella sp. 419]|nr:hypothetical protein FRC03_006714 [Tulasnella sp. 419]